MLAGVEFVEIVLYEFQNFNKFFHKQFIKCNQLQAHAHTHYTQLHRTSSVVCVEVYAVGINRDKRYFCYRKKKFRFKKKKKTTKKETGRKQKVKILIKHYINFKDIRRNKN